MVQELNGALRFEWYALRMDVLRSITMAAQKQLLWGYALVLATEASGIEGRQLEAYTLVF